VIKFALPPYDPDSLLTFDFTFQVYFERLYKSAVSGPIVNVWVDHFVGLVPVPSAPIAKADRIGLYSFRTSLRFIPSSAGWNGGEGWFTLSTTGDMFVTDCLITYTPRGAHGTRTDQGYFS